MPSPAPIKRNPALVPLSRDHHQGLLLCWKIRQGLKAGVEPGRITAYIHCFFEQDLAEHFRQEEEWIFPLLPATHPERIIAEAQHGELRAIVDGLDRTNTPQEALTHFADRLDAHIRFEERTLFTTIEHTADEATLREVNARLLQTPHGGEPVWDDAFWKPQNPS